MPSPIALKVEGLSKSYRLGVTHAGSLREAINGTVQRLFGGRRQAAAPVAPHSGGRPASSSRHQSQGLFWALRDVSFEVQPGEVVGVIGRNGAGKSTLLKILSRITQPTAGRVEFHGRVASLLEVGTGFHPELTGRENVYMNGAILGMTRREITSKLDEIVAFADIAEFLDTPVKRYSSGMSVRLGFAVAAHLDPEILIVDEVLAVGDAAFQRKCLEKMSEVSATGRTVLFVSHNMAAIRSLCPRAIWLADGKLLAAGPSSELLNAYAAEDAASSFKKTWEESAYHVKPVGFHSIRITSDGGGEGRLMTTETPVDVTFCIRTAGKDTDLHVRLNLLDLQGSCVFASDSPVFRGERELEVLRCRIPANLLNDGQYRIDVTLAANASTVLDANVGQLGFAVVEASRQSRWFGKWPGAVRPLLDWDVAEADAEPHAVA